MAEASAPQCLALSCHIALSGADEAAPDSLAAAQLIQAGVIRLWKSEAGLALARRFAKTRGPDGASESTRHANLASVQSSSRKRKATLGVNKAVMKSPSVPMKHARALQQPPHGVPYKLIVVLMLDRTVASRFSTGPASPQCGALTLPNFDVAMPSPLSSPPHEYEAERDDLPDHFEDLEATITAATAAAGPASPVMDLDDYEGLLGFLSKVELQAKGCITVDMFGDECSAVWPAGPLQAA
eukprot:SM000028S10100  [mRNA]  locus=s28:349239:350341:- [translate_table: standard]